MSKVLAVLSNHAGLLVVLVAVLVFAFVTERFTSKPATVHQVQQVEHTVTNTVTVEKPVDRVIERTITKYVPVPAADGGCPTCEVASVTHETEHDTGGGATTTTKVDDREALKVKDTSSGTELPHWLIEATYNTKGQPGGAVHYRVAGPFWLGAGAEGGNGSFDARVMFGVSF